MTDNELQERAQKDRQEVFDKAWNGMSAADMAQLVQSLTQQNPTLKKQGHVQKEQKNRKTREQMWEDNQEIHASAATGGFAKGADVLFAKDLADLLFKLHIGEGATTSKEKFDSKCLAQIIVLSYIYGSRVEDIFDLPPENLIQDRCELRLINLKKYATLEKAITVSSSLIR